MNNETEQIFLLNPTESQPSSASQKLEEASVAPQDVEDFSTVCRTCATVTEFVIPIFDGEGLQNNFAEKIHKHLPIQVSESDVLPRVVCYQCASTLLAWHELVQCCVQADAALRTRLAVAAAADSARTTDTESKSSSKEILQNSEQEQNKQNNELPHGQTDSNGATESERPAHKLPEEDSEKPSVVSVGDDGKRYANCQICKKNVNIGSWRRHARQHRGEKRYSCHTCGLSFSDSGNLARHARAVHGQQRPYSCTACPKSFSRTEHLEDHLRSHSDSREFVCDVCGRASKSYAALRMHRKIHDACRYRCMECGSEFKRRGELRAHVTVHTGEKAFACVCGKSFRLRGQLTTHARTHDKAESAPQTSPAFKEIADFVVRSLDPPRYAPPGRACAYCGAEHPHHAYRDHLVAAHSDRLFHCDECDTYVDRKDFILHMSLHAVEYAAKQERRSEPIERVKRVKKRKSEAKDENENNERGGRRPTRGGGGDSDGKPNDGRMPSVGASDPRENEFSDHSDTEYGFGPLPESVFEAIEDSQDGRSTNEVEVGSSPVEDDGRAPAAGDADAAPEPGSATKTHKKSRTCPICGKVYTASSSYFYHMKHFHERSREHECDVCGKKFGTRARLAEHAAVHTGECRHECKACGKRFRTRASLYIHEQTHGGVKSWSCSQCQRAFRWRTHLGRHLQRHAAQRAHECGACGRGFSVRGDLLRHARTHAAQAHACQRCPRSFAQLRYLKVHMDRKHAGDEKPASVAEVTI